jgi:hypothetical protein
MIVRNPKDPFGEGPEAAKARRNRSWAIAFGLFAFIALVFVITLVKLSGNVAP